MRRPALRHLVIPALLLSLALAGCASSGDGGSADRPLVPADAEPGTYWQGERSQSAERAQLVARSDREWTELWARVGQEPPSRGLPGGRMAVGIFLGYRDTGGYGVTIEQVAVKDGALVVNYRERVPGPTAAVVQAITSPFAVRLVPAAEGTAKFVRVR
ncbi:protease complex subunit PrcB family protein [Azospirillum sp. RWY-5-1]|uniref:Protease complex subunit PrcB family protein n=1 Tax=Azospirillum oleiclasticum TaxID=2735135 RepID=A0ABX2T843_9PROT|nr:protease complex subunit PrcB family protein [Azospirillum oleiclasticum]NYZ13314.1 protease complex subunit PrcB family protein [Azospirillum oleiclasticum]NYZ20475.1 protease complex subunit PrcB family protein [Azospirillum oleiclasticum]